MNLQDIFGSNEDLKREFKFCIRFNDFLVKRLEEIEMTDDEYYGFDIRIPANHKINSENTVPSPEPLHAGCIAQKNYCEKPRIIHIRCISYESFCEVYENPDILIIKKD